MVYDLFHVVAKYGREVIDRVRVDEANRLRHDKPAPKVIKRMAYGYRDSEFFFRKIKSAFPGNPQGHMTAPATATATGS